MKARLRGQMRLFREECWCPLSAPQIAGVRRVVQEADAAARGGVTHGRNLAT